MPSVAHPVPFEAYTGDEPYIFVSYAHKDAELDYGDFLFFHKLGYRIWYDEGIDPGNEWSVDIEKAITACSFFIVYVSPNSVASRNVRNEINLALNLNKEFLAIHLEPTQLPSGLNLRMGDIQAIFKYNHTGNSFERKINKVFSQKLRQTDRNEPAHKTEQDNAELVPPAALEQPPANLTAGRPKWFLGAGMSLGVLAVFLMGVILYTNINHPAGPMVSTTIPAPKVDSPTPPPIQITPTTPAGGAPSTEPSTGSPNASGSETQGHAFADPIMAAVAKLPPSYADDFKVNTGNWKSTDMSNKGYTGNGQFFMEVQDNKDNPPCKDVGFYPLPTGVSDFVLEIEGQNVKTPAGDWSVQFRKQNDAVKKCGSQFSVNINGDRRGVLMTGDCGQNIILSEFPVPAPVPSSQPDRVQIVARAHQIAGFVNGQAVAYTTDNNLLTGAITLDVCNKNPSPIRVEFGNFKLWDISHLKIP